MQYVSVVSSNVSALGYDPDKQELRVRFKNGGEYAYTGVPSDEYESMLSAPSVGSYFSNYVKDTYPFTRV